MRLMTLGILALLTACSASPKVAVRASDAASDPSYTPPEEVQLAVHESTPAPKVLELPAFAAPKPNKSATEKHALHAAAY